MNVSNVNGVGRVVLSNQPRETTADGGSTPPPDRGLGEAAKAGTASSPTSLVEYDEQTNQPLPPRFPWLSRLTRELEPASKQPSPYGSVPVLGERLDKTA